MEYKSIMENAAPKARGLMLKGLKQFCNENPNALKAKAMYKKLSENIEVDNYWLEVYEKYINKNRTDSEEKHFKYAESKMKI